RPLAARPLGRLPAQSDPAHLVGAREMVVARSCNFDRRPRWRLASRLSRLRKRLLDTRAPNLTRAGGMDRRQLVPPARRRSLAPVAQTLAAAQPRSRRAVQR